MIFVGNDWSEASHELWVMDETGEKLANPRLGEGVEGLRRLHQLLAVYTRQPEQVVMGVETDRGLWVGAMVAAGYQVYAINPKAVARYRDRHHVGGGKSDVADAKLLADLVRTDRHNHRRIAGDSPEVEAIKLWARTHQKLCWDQNRHSNRLRSGLLQYYPAALATFSDLTDRDALAVLATAPCPALGKKLTVPKIRAALQKSGRQRRLQTRAEQIRAGLQTAELEAPAPLVAALTAATKAEVAIIAEIGRQIEDLEQQIADRFNQHPDADLYLSLPGIGLVLGARMLGEFGDDPDRYPQAKSRRNYAGTSPLTIASGKKHKVVSRHVRNRYLHQNVLRWAFCSLQRSPGCKSFYDQRRQLGDSHSQALRALANRLISILHGCLSTRTPYNEDTAWQHRHQNPQPHAA